MSYLWTRERIAAIRDGRIPSPYAKFAKGTPCDINRRLGVRTVPNEGDDAPGCSDLLVNLRTAFGKGTKFSAKEASAKVGGSAVVMRKKIRELTTKGRLALAEKGGGRFPSRWRFPESTESSR